MPKCEERCYINAIKMQLSSTAADDVWRESLFIVVRHQKDKKQITPLKRTVCLANQGGECQDSNESTAAAYLVQSPVESLSRDFKSVQKLGRVPFFLLLFFLRFFAQTSASCSDRNYVWERGRKPKQVSYPIKELQLFTRARTNLR